ncbi:hypothetical protein WISP_107722 [Willisornis vidua]|uniref:Uncharacterized protein n=1 Tax=Willisornis vidua TaxID=1566151 RepID=A0ABQ9D1W4_9PASS|nr:hypothetical protein WISP_107722 [Willisornis vidua]
MEEFTLICICQGSLTDGFMVPLIASTELLRVGEPVKNKESSFMFCVQLAQFLATQRAWVDERHGDDSIVSDELNNPAVRVFGLHGPEETGMAQTISVRKEVTLP